MKLYHNRHVRRVYENSRVNGTPPVAALSRARSALQERCPERDSLPGATSLATAALFFAESAEQQQETF
jgi:hypothetical protein